MLDFLHKEVVADWSYNSAAMNRNFEERVLVNGHTATILRTKPVAMMVGTVYRVYDPSVKSNKFVLHIGYAEASHYENVVIGPKTIELLTEEAQTNKLISPTITMTFDTMPSLSLFNDICEAYFKTTNKSILSLNEVQYEVSHSSEYDRRYPYDWIYFKKYKRMEFINGC